MRGKVMAVWGKSGCGKTTIAVNLACALSEQYIVGVISSKLCYGELQAFFGQRIDEDKGLYKALFDASAVKSAFAECKLNSNIFLLSPPSQFDALNLSLITKEQVQDMINEAALYVDYLIIDGSEDINNAVSSVGIAEADIVLTAYRLSVTTYLWHEGIDKLSNLLYLKEKTIHILNGDDGSCDLLTFRNNANVKFEFYLPYMREATLCQNTGSPILLSKSKDTKPYIKEIRRLAARLKQGGV